MMTMENKSKAKKIFLLVPALFAAVLMGFMFLSCDVGDEPDPPTGPDTVYDPDFDENRPGINVRVRPNRITVPDPVTNEDNDDIVVQAWYRDPAGMPVQGLQMNFTSDPESSNFVFQPSATFTDGDGQASVVMVVSKNTPRGSYTVVAYTSPASAGPNAKGYGRFYVTVGETVSTPAMPGVSPPNPGDSNIVPGTVTITVGVSSADAASSLGNPVFYRFECDGVAQPYLGPGVTSDNCVAISQTGIPAGGTTNFSFRAQARSSTGVVSDWSPAASVTVTDLP